jgi:hypothetical protein
VDIEFASQHRDAGTRPAGAGAQQPEAGLHHRQQAVGGLPTLEAIFAITQEGEMVVGEPFEERGRLERLGTRDSRDAAGHVRCELARVSQHGRPVLDRRAHVGEGRLDPRPNVLEVRGVGRAAHLDMLPGLDESRPGARVDVLDPSGPVADDAEHRMRHRMDGPTGIVQDDCERIDQERHVIGDDLDDRVRGLPALGRERRIEHANQRAAALADRAEPQVAYCSGGQRRRRAGAQIGLVDTVVIGPDEIADRDLRPAAAAAAALAGDRIDEVLAGSGNCSWHGSSFAGCRPADDVL